MSVKAEVEALEAELKDEDPQKIVSEHIRTLNQVSWEDVLLLN